MTETQTAEPTSHVGRLWNGRVPLGRAFWLSGAVGMTLLSILSLALTGLLVAVRHEDKLVALTVSLLWVFFHLAALAYAAVWSVGVWRSAGGYKGLSLWSLAARAVVAVTAAAAAVGLLSPLLQAVQP